MAATSGSRMSPQMLEFKNARKEEKMAQVAEGSKDDTHDTKQPGDANSASKKKTWKLNI